MVVEVAAPLGNTHTPQNTIYLPWKTEDNQGFTAAFSGAYLGFNRVLLIFLTGVLTVWEN